MLARQLPSQLAGRVGPSVVKEICSGLTPGLFDVPGISAVPLTTIFRRWATKKAAGSTHNGRDSQPKFLGVKKFGGQKVIPGNIIVRQRGTRFHPGNYVGMGKDHTLYALREGHVKFEKNKLTGRKWVHVDPIDGHIIHPVYQKGITLEEA